MIPVYDPDQPVGERVIHPAILNEPRIAPQQRSYLEALDAASDDVHIVAMDAYQRPVVKIRADGGLRVVAVLRRGGETKVRQPLVPWPVPARKTRGRTRRSRRR